MPLTFLGKQYIYIITWSKWDANRCLGFTAIDRDRLYESRLYVRFSFLANEKDFLWKRFVTKDEMDFILKWVSKIHLI